MLIESGGSGLSMSALAETVGISRPTLYRYYPDLDSVLIGIAELVARHDDAFVSVIRAEPDPSTQLRIFLDEVVNQDSHGPMTAAAIEAALPPAGRELLRSHEERARSILADILLRGVQSGCFAAEIDPATDARFILGLAQQAQPDTIDRVHLLVDKILRPARKRKP